MKILILNWRDISNPKSGGAEVLTHEIAKRWVDLGNQVTQFSSRFENSKSEEIIDGVKIIRRGHPDVRYFFSSVHFLAFWNYKKHFEGKFDVVIDEVHGLPFFTPWYVKERKVALVCEVANELWTTMFGLFFGIIGKIVEWSYLHLFYKNIEFLTISESSKTDLVNEGVDKARITVLPMGISIPNFLKSYDKEKDPTLIFVGRLSKPKGVEDAIISLKKILKHLPKARLWIVGYGEDKYQDDLNTLTKKLDLEKNVIFWGFVSDVKKFELLQKAHILLAPSIKEGWGLTIPEAAAVGTPSIVYNSPGLRDVLKGSPFKVIVKSNSPSELAEEVINFFQNKAPYKNLQKQKLQIVKIFNWDNTAKVALEVLNK